MISALLLPSVIVVQTSAQRPDTTSMAARLRFASEPNSAERYEPVFDGLRRMAPRDDAVAQVRNLTIQRDVIHFKFTDGRLYLLTPIAGRTVGAVFIGHGSVALAPPLRVERAQLAHVLGDSVVDSPISAAVLMFTDSTVTELQRTLTFGPGPVAGDVSGAVNDALDRLLDARSWQAESSALMTALLNSDTTGFFYGSVKREHGEDLTFEVDPSQAEPVELLRAGKLSGQRVQVVSQFPRAEDLRDSVAVGVERPEPVKIDSYRIDATMNTNLDYSANATIQLTARREGVRWIPFLLYEELKVDSVVDETASADTFFRAKHSPELWVRLAAPLHVGQTRSVRVWYHGDLITFGSLMEGFERMWMDSVPRQWRDSIRRLLPPALDRWFFLKDPERWFPRYGPTTYR